VRLGSCFNEAAAMMPRRVPVRTDLRIEVLIGPSVRPRHGCRGRPSTCHPRSCPPVEASSLGPIPFNEAAASMPRKFGRIFSIRNPSIGCFNEAAAWMQRKASPISSRACRRSRASMKPRHGCRGRADPPRRGGPVRQSTCFNEAAARRSRKVELTIKHPLFAKALQ
jgi:hypothetical protein